MLVNAIGREFGLGFIAISAYSIITGISGEPERGIQNFFEEAREIALCLTFIDDTQAYIEDLAMEAMGGKPVMVIDATDRPDSLDPSLGEAGVFDGEICVNMPDEAGREKILRVVFQKMRLPRDFDYKQLAKKTRGYFGGDLSALASLAAGGAIRRFCGAVQILPTATDSLEVGAVAELGDTASMDVDRADSLPLSLPQQITPDSSSRYSAPPLFKAHRDGCTKKLLDSLHVTFPDFLTALTKIQPTCKRFGFAIVPDVTWEDIGAIGSLKVEMQMAIVVPVKNPELSTSVGITAPKGALLWGPPGCGKTLLAQAISNETGANFIGIQGPELSSKYVEESERVVCRVFSRARACIRCVIFFDELDGLAPRSTDPLSESSSPVVDTLLAQLDSLKDRKGIYVIGESNRPDLVEPAMLESGRLDQLLFIDLPNKDGRFEILQSITERTPLSQVDLRAVAEDNKCKGFSGADLAALVEKAAIQALLRDRCNDVGGIEEGENTSNSPVLVTAPDFEKTFAEIAPSVSESDRERYAEFAAAFDLRRGRSSWGRIR
ncbi:P-loop containing nucleoside triphosphate hydrolase protein [Tuber brumale]|nr:P-loop containing nucleoside triphosphate hydrolase protein [Tuber brumale]